MRVRDLFEHEPDVADLPLIYDLIKQRIPGPLPVLIVDDEGIRHLVTRIGWREDEHTEEGMGVWMTWRTGDYINDKEAGRYSAGSDSLSWELWQLGEWRLTKKDGYWELKT
jgi:hypothetical protein